MKKICVLLIIILVATTQASCWSRREIEDLGFVMGLGVCRTDAGLYTITVQFANPSAIVAENPDQRYIYTIMEGHGLSIFDALRNLSMVAGRRLFLSHVNVIIIEESLAKEGIKDFLGFLLQDMEVRLEQEVFISKIPPKEILDTPNTLGVIPAMALHSMALNQGANSKIYVADLHEALEAVHSPVNNFVTSLVEIIPAPTENEMDFLNLTEIAIFEHDRLIGYLHHEDGQSYNFITNNFENGVIVFERSEKEDIITIEVLQSTTDIVPKYSNGKVGFDISLDVNGNIAGRTIQTELREPVIIEDVNNQFAKVLLDKLNKSIITAQQDFGVDYYNLSGHFARKYPKEFANMKDDWNKHFAEADITVTVKTEIVHSALGTLGGDE
ncbi:Ger(x)C family spore germination protein [Alkalicella caledoniensis]|uniref:Ger(X)C family spore germination protein n=1 Tax=Alkalicella caledoniensis TaxID=2731377 RepID=A0A7G9W7T7_ALKCA|nr:Ger(x)C family spore germination protein [Alkalicella caledoniensis]QNO14749.1 Ger(x)C family spore germination protein [Alkalicella caledoniensis]